MSDKQQGVLSCSSLSWIAGLLMGFAAYLILRMRLDTGFVIAAIVALVIAVLVALVLLRMFCADQPEASATPARPSPAQPARTDSADAAAKAAAAKAAEEAAAAKAAEEEAAAKAAEEEAAAKAAEEAAAAKAAEEAETTPDYDKDGVREGENEGTRPAALSGPRDGKADNLKEIKGIGPKLEILCNELGFYHFDQIAAWSADEVAWVNANLKGFKGRVSRDNWVEQAAILAAGGETEFSKRVEDGDVY